MRKLVSIIIKTIIFISIFLGLSVLVASSKALAQEHTCMWVEHLPGDGLCESTSYCPSGFHPRTSCADFGSNECDGAHPCDPDPPSTECNQACNNNCTPSCVGVSDEYLCKVQEVTGGIKICCCYPPGEVVPFDPCKDIKDPGTQEACYDCVGQPDAPTGDSWTAIGCITTSDPQAFIAWLLGAVIGIGGGIAFLLMLWGGFQIITSTGDPEKLNRGKEILTSAIIGLVVIIFSVFLLQLIGVKILQIPGFGTP